MLADKQSVHCEELEGDVEEVEDVKRAKVPPPLP